MVYLKQELNIHPDTSREFFCGAFRDCLVGRADLKEAIAPFLPYWGWKGTVNDFLRRWFQEEHHINHSLIKVIRILRQRGFRCVVATNQERYRLAYMRDEMGFSDLFDGIFGSADVGAVKPARAFYERVTSLLDVDPWEIVFWDDSVENVEGARAFGWSAEHFIDLDKFLSALSFHAGVSTRNLA